MNRFQVLPGKESEFEKTWRDREQFLDEVPGFLTFSLLRGQDGEFISHSTWESEQHFRDWTESEAFRKAHARGGSAGLIQGPPRFSGYQVVL
ncbi:MAG: antibiotic biosynthesis monooxygenase [Planctomycetota bacterium]